MSSISDSKVAFSLKLRLVRLVSIFFIAMSLGIYTSSADEVTVTAGGDDSSYLIPNTTIVYQGVTYTNSVYITTNSVITFGNGDGTYNDYPNLASISFNSIDWVQYPNINADEHLIITTRSGGFTIDLAGRPWGTSGLDLTNIIINAFIDANGEASYTFSVSGPDYATEVDQWGQTQRTGARTAIGATVVTEGSASWPSFRVSRTSNQAIPLVSVSAPEMSTSSGKLSCTSGTYKIGSGSNEDINSVAYTLWVNGSPVSRIAYDTAGAINPQMFSPLTQSVSGIATKQSATWDVSNLMNYTAHCEVFVVKSGATFNAQSNEITDSVKTAEIAAKAQAWEDQRSTATAANFTKEAREARKRAAARAVNG